LVWCLGLPIFRKEVKMKKILLYSVT